MRDGSAYLLSSVLDETDNEARSLSCVVFHLPPTLSLFASTEFCIPRQVKWGCYLYAAEPGPGKVSHGPKETEEPAMKPNSQIQPKRKNK